MWEALALSFGLAMDATAVAAARALSNRRPSEAVVLPLLFGLFQGGMAALGWILGRWGGPYIAAWDHWIAFGLLVALGGKMLHDAWRSDEEDDDKPQAGVIVYLALALATSIDAAAAGITLPLIEVAPWVAILMIGLVTAACSAIGYAAGRTASAKLGPRLEVVGALVLIAIGVRILVQHL